MLAHYQKVVAVILGLFLYGSVNAEQYRLSKNVIPQDQKVMLTLDPHRDSFAGSTSITLKIKEATATIQLHGVDLTVTQAKVGELVFTVSSITDGIITLKAAAPLSVGVHLLELAFDGEFNRQSVGLYKSIDQGTPYLFTQFEMSDARRSFPVFDEPNFKIPFQLTIKAPKDEMVVSNTPVLTVREEGDWRIHEFAQTPPIPSYLVAMAVGPFEVLKVDGMSVPGNILTPKGKIGLAEFSAQQTPIILRAMEEYFGTPYVYKKLDQVALPEFPFGAMENAGLVTYREDILLIDPATAAIKDKRRSVSVVAHELAHQWYGNLVTMKWWDDLWLNEAFATWMAAKVVGQLYPEMESDLLLPQNRVMVSDARLSTKPIRKPVKSEADIMDGLGLSYSKGSAVLSMVERWIGEKKFRKGIRRYMKTYSWGNAEAADLWDALGRASGKDVKSVLKSFTEQSGFPLLSLETDGRVLTVSQERFANAGVDAPAQLWTLPVSIRYGAGNKQASTSILLSSESRSVKLKFKPDWIFPDDGGVGYYRWKLSAAKNDQLKANIAVLSSKEKLAYINNTQSLMLAGKMSAGDMIAALQVFLSDDHPLIVKEALTMITAMKTPFIDDSNEAGWRRLVMNALSPAIERFGMLPKPNENPHVTSLRPDILNALAKDGGDKDIIELARSKTAKFFKDPTSVDTRLAETFLGIAAHYGDETLLEQIKGLLRSVIDPHRRTLLLKSLGLFGPASIHDAAMDMMLDDRVTASDLHYLLVYNAKRTDRLVRMQSWMFRNFDALSKKSPPFVVPSFPLYLGGACDAASLQKIRTFFSEKAKLVSGMNRSLEKVSERISDCIDLRARELSSVNRYLEN